MSEYEAERIRKGRTGLVIGVDNGSHAFLFVNLSDGTLHAICEQSADTTMWLGDTYSLLLFFWNPAHRMSEATLS